MKIKHLVISGGGPTMIKSLGASQYLEQNNFWNIGDIQSIHGTSAGALVGAMLCLKYDWETLNTYIIERPWDEAFSFNIKLMLDSYTNRGIYGRKASEIIFKSLLLGKDLSLDITMKEFYEYCNIELYVYSLEVNNFKMESISFKTYPDLPLLTALQMTSAIPILVCPVCFDEKCFIDGAVISNYPLNYCLELVDDADEILGFKNDYGEKRESSKVNSESTLLDYIMIFLYKLIFQLNTEDKQINIANEVIYSAKYLSFDYIKSVLSSCEIRKEFLESGIESAKIFLEKKGTHVPLNPNAKMNM
jgi:predicted acylesterase/phospholipase RssA